MTIATTTLPGSSLPDGIVNNELEVIAAAANALFKETKESRQLDNDDTTAIKNELVKAWQPPEGFKQHDAHTPKRQWLPASPDETLPHWPELQTTTASQNIQATPLASSSSHITNAPKATPSSVVHIDQKEVPHIDSLNQPWQNQNAFGFLDDAAINHLAHSSETALPKNHTLGQRNSQLNQYKQPQTSQHNPFYFVTPQLIPTNKTQHSTVFPVDRIRCDFPILNERVNGQPLVWFDNAATTQKPQAVIDRVAYFYAHENSNIHRAAHEIAARATDAYEHARDTVRRFIGAASADEIIFVRGTTEGINLIANTWGQENIAAGDEIIVSHLEHHANIVPWQMLATRTGAIIKVIPVDDDGQIILSEYQKLLSKRTKLVAVTQVSNALGTVTPMARIIALAHQAGALAWLTQHNLSLI
ncbi:aminotransferase class V-fold PLP-dependent enzyme [Snodgrassella sp. CFCC 13594]|uniref:aminotransferase class V-fold PLP-dependent enzyme n=1 Tax=Snodgrassella sp. CFCC 13594 TaxID=1775559 RepID=UPI000AB9AA70|nr:aminotransferase class V-fold PLP-dependent enzyme [Snodgrassella sp. CFCC 13594]